MALTVPSSDHVLSSNMSINKSDIWEHWTTTPDVSSFKRAFTQSSVQLLFDASEDTQQDVYNTIKFLGKQVVVESTDLEDADSHDDIQGILTNEISVFRVRASNEEEEIRAINMVSVSIFDKEGSVNSARILHEN